VLAEPNFKVLRYNYDFGDDWRHIIKVELHFSAELWHEFPKLIDAKGR
jgi:Plasmid pRiA4b ORF-3-like protein